MGTRRAHIFHVPGSSRFYVERAALFVRASTNRVKLRWADNLKTDGAEYLVVGSVPHPGRRMDFEALLSSLEHHPLPHHRIFLVGQLESPDEYRLVEDALARKVVGVYARFAVGGADVRLCPCLRRDLVRHGTGADGSPRMLDSVGSARDFIRDLLNLIETAENPPGNPAERLS